MYPIKSLRLLQLMDKVHQLEPLCSIQDREVSPDIRGSDFRYAVAVDRGFQALVILGEGNSIEEALQNTLETYQKPVPREPSYAELETSLQTREHIDLIRTFLREFAVELLRRGETHDRSKLDRAEVDMFTEYTKRLKDMTYGSDEYKQCLKEMGPALQHHYQHNRHHPEHFQNGLEGMNLVDILEMFIDWKASVRRHSDGDLQKSIEINEKRFGMSPQLAQIFRNTIRDYGA
jgi:hypothetical protein